VWVKKKKTTKLKFDIEIFAALIRSLSRSINKSFACAGGKERGREKRSPSAHKLQCGNVRTGFSVALF